MIEFVTPSDWQTVPVQPKIVCTCSSAGLALHARIVTRGDFTTNGFSASPAVAEFPLSEEVEDGRYAATCPDRLPDGAFVVGVWAQELPGSIALIGINVRQETGASMAAPDDLAAMFDEISGSDGLYKPSRFWDDMSMLNTRQLLTEGFGNFKRTVNQNYYNWIPEAASSNQFRNLLRFWSENPDMLPLKVQMEDVDLLQGFFEKNPLSVPENRDLYRLFTGMLWLFAKRRDEYGLTDRLDEPQVGNPIRTTLEGRAISQDLANSIREWTVIRHQSDVMGLDRPVIAELGAGYGRLADVALKASQARYAIFDIPPALWISQKYIEECNPGKKLFRFRHFEHFDQVRHEVEESDIAFFCANQLELVPDDYFDGFVAISCLHEMRKDQIHNYKALITRVTRGFFYTKNWIRWENQTDQIEVRYEDIRMGDGWTAAMERTDPVQDEFMESMFLRDAGPRDRKTA